MRVISQNGTIDIPYEMTAFHLAGGMIYMSMVGDIGKGTLMAQYVTLEKAEKAMEMLHITFESALYSDHAFDNAAMVHRPYTFVKNKIFRFPADDEIEVEE